MVAAMSDREDAIYDRLDAIASSIEEECEIIGLLESVKKEILEKTT